MWQLVHCLIAVVVSKNIVTAVVEVGGLFNDGVPANRLRRWEHRSRFHSVLLDRMINQAKIVFRGHRL